MFRRLPSLHALAAFESAARQQSFAKAAEELHLTHSAVSHRIKQLEVSLETRLFLRMNRNVVLTAAGATFLEAVREALHRLQSASKQLSSGGRTPLRTTVAPALASNWLALRIADFQARYPTVDLEIQSTSQMVNLRSGEVDVGIRMGHGNWTGYHCEKLFADELYPVCSPGYVRKSGPIRVPSDLKGRTLLRNSRIPWKEWFAVAGLEWDEPSSGPLFSEISVLLDAAASDAGIALSGRIVSAPAIASGRLVRLLNIASRPLRAYYAVCLPAKLKRPEVAAFIAWLRSEASVMDFHASKEDSSSDCVRAPE